MSASRARRLLGALLEMLFDLVQVGILFAVAAAVTWGTGGDLLDALLGVVAIRLVIVERRLRDHERGHVRPWLSR